LYLTVYCGYKVYNFYLSAVKFLLLEGFAGIRAWIVQLCRIFVIESYNIDDNLAVLMNFKLSHFSKFNVCCDHKFQLKADKLNRKIIITD